jgi:hypothetical protein
MDAINSVCNPTTGSNQEEKNTSVTLDDVNMNFSKKTRCHSHQNVNITDPEQHQQQQDVEEFNENDSCSGNESSISVINPSSVKNMTEFDEDDEDMATAATNATRTAEIKEIEEEILSDLDRSSTRQPPPKRTPSSSSLKNKSSKENTLTLSDICTHGNTFLWDLLINQSMSCQNSNQSNATQAFTADASFNTSDAARNESCTNLNHSQSSISNNSSINSSQNSLNKKQQQQQAKASADSANSLTQKQKILREAEKQLQVLLCLPSTDKRVRLQFIQSCIQNLSENKVVHVSLRLLMKLFSSFQQYANPNQHNNSSSSSLLKLDAEKGANSTISRTQQSILSLSQTNTSRHLQSHFNTPGNVLEVHKIVAWCEMNFALVQTFATSLAEFARVELGKLAEPGLDARAKAELIGQIRLSVQTRLQFLSFLFSSLGSPKDFELSTRHVECLWDSLIQFDDFVVEQQTLATSSINVASSMASLPTPTGLTEQVHFLTIIKFFMH